jgi:hypothetical protein
MQVLLQRYCYGYSKFKLSILAEQKIYCGLRMQRAFVADNTFSPDIKD